MAERRLLICECGWKRITDLSDPDLYELKSDTMSSRKFRCRSCGKAVTPRKIQDPQSEVDRKRREEELAEENRRWMEESIAAKERFMKEIADGQEDNPE